MFSMLNVALNREEEEEEEEEEGVIPLFKHKVQSSLVC